MANTTQIPGLAQPRYPRPPRLSLWVTAGLVLAGLAGAGSARADRFQRGQLVYDSLCTNCHTTGWKSAVNEKNRVDITRAVDHLNDEQLRRFLALPHRVREQSECVHQSLEAQQVEDLITFLHVHATGAPAVPRTPPRSHNPLSQLPPAARPDAPPVLTPSARPASARGVKK